MTLSVVVRPLLPPLRVSSVLVFISVFALSAEVAVDEKVEGAFVVKVPSSESSDCIIVLIAALVTEVDFHCVIVVGLLMVITVELIEVFVSGFGVLFVDTDSYVLVLIGVLVVRDKVIAEVVISVVPLVKVSV